jgi:hypothetical protein
MWFPSLVICSVGNFVSISPWVYWGGATWSHLQGLVSSIVSLTKPDIKEAVVSLLYCKLEQEEGETRLRDDNASSIRISLMDSMLFNFLLSRGRGRQRSSGGRAAAAAAKEEYATRLSSNTTGSALIVSAERYIEDHSDVQDDLVLQNLSDVPENKNVEVDAEAMIGSPGSLLAKDGMSTTSMDQQSPRMTMLSVPTQVSPGRRVSIGIPSKLNIPSASLEVDDGGGASPRHSVKRPTEGISGNEIPN